MMPSCTYAVTYQTQLIAVNFMTQLMINKDPTAIDRFISPAYINHNPQTVDLASFKAFAQQLPTTPGFRWEPSGVVTNCDIAMVYGRYTGLPFSPAPTVGVDIFRVANGQIAEHWDILQPEITPTASGVPMFSKI